MIYLQLLVQSPMTIHWLYDELGVDDFAGEFPRK